MFEITICPVKKLYTIAADADLEDVAAIMVSSYEIDTSKLGSLGRYIIFSFADTEESDLDSAISDGIANQICSFVKELPNDLDTLFVCCDSGESRSTAMAAAIARYKRLDEWPIWDDPRYHPNGLVYRKVCEGFGINVNDDDIRLRKQRNGDALKRLINRQ